MSYSIHSTPRANFPRSEAQATLRAIAGLQDATTFQQARDALLRFYYPVLRGWLRKNQDNKEKRREAEEWALDLTHSNESSAILFGRKVCLGSPQPESLEKLQKCIDEARKDKAATPYERVGHVLAWLKQARGQDPQLQWGHSYLRQWMQGLLLDFTLYDAKKKPGALLDKPEEQYQTMVDQWSEKNTGLPFDRVWELFGQRRFSKELEPGNLLVANDGSAEREAFALRAEILQRHNPAALLLVHPELGATREFRPNWRDVSDYGVLHPLLTQDEMSFNKSVWMDVLQYQGKRWSTPENAGKWHEWQERAAMSYQAVVQTYAGSTVHAVTRSISLTRRRNPQCELAFDTTFPLQLDWFAVLTQLATRFPYLNESPELNALAKDKLSVEHYQQFCLDSERRMGQPFVHTVLSVPQELQDKNALNMPAWFHVHLQALMKHRHQLDLPEHLMDGNQAPSLY